MREIEMTQHEKQRSSGRLLCGVATNSSGEELKLNNAPVFPSRKTKPGFVPSNKAPA